MILAMRAPRGFTVVEVVIALIILAIGILGLAAETATLTRRLARARRAAEVSAAAAARLERLRAGGCIARADGTEPVRHGSAPLALLRWTWSTTGDSTYLARLTVTPAGAAAARLMRPETLTAVLLCDR
jgi:prepilin-type N-terminal cleavage/methylation domain-containing protein